MILFAVDKVIENISRISSNARYALIMSESILYSKFHILYFIDIYLFFKYIFFYAIKKILLLYQEDHKSLITFYLKYFSISELSSA